MKETTEGTDNKLHQRVLKCAKYAQQAWNKQRKREKEDLQFQVPELQWDEDARQQRRGMTGGNGQVPVPARPMLSISLIEQPVQLVNNQMRAAHLGINVHPLSAEAEEETAEVIQGIIRDIDRNSGSDGVNWAFDRASKCGFGVLEVVTQYDDEGGSPFDQVIRIKRILDQGQVYLDPAAIKPDFSDGRFALHLAWYSVQAFEAAFPGVEVPEGNNSIFSEDENVPEWVQTDGETTTAVCVAKYWEVEEKPETISLGSDGQVYGPQDPMPPGIRPVKKRDRMVRKVYSSLHTCDGVIPNEDGEERDTWAGKYIPLVPAIGSELQPFNDERMWVGIIRPARDSQKGFNYAISQAIESVALEPKAPYHAYEGQLEGHESEWQQANNRNFPVLTSKPVVVQGTLLPPPSRMQIDSTRMQGALNLSQVFMGGVQSTTKQFDPSLGQQKGQQSGRAISELQEQAESSNSHYVANLADVTYNCLARILLDLIPVIYDRPGRIARTLGEEDETNSVMLNAPFRTDQNTEQPVRANDVDPSQPLPPGVKQFDLRKGIYGLSVSIGKSYQSRLQQGADEIGQILQSNPQLLPLIGPLYFRYRDFPGAEQVADILKKVQNKQFPYLDEPEEGQKPTPEQLSSQNEQLKGQLQQAQQQLQAGAEMVKTDQIKNQATLQKAQMDNQSKAEIEQMKAQIQILLKKMDIDAENKRTGADIVQESVEANKDRAHESMIEAQKHGQNMEASAMGTLSPVDLNFKTANPQSLGEEDVY